jgi:hypothetical protein
MASAYLLYDNRNIGRNYLVREVYYNLKAEKLIDSVMLERRIREVRDRKFPPTFK